MVDFDSEGRPSEGIKQSAEPGRSSPEGPERLKAGRVGRNCCVHVGSTAIFSRSRHAALPGSGRSQLLGPETQDVTREQARRRERGGSPVTCSVYFLSPLTSPGCQTAAERPASDRLRCHHGN